MKKIMTFTLENLVRLLLSVLIIAVIVTKCTAQSFDGVPITGDMNSTIARFKAKGYRLVAMDDNKEYAMIRGEVANTEVDVLILVTPKTKKVFSFGVYFPKQMSYKGLKRDFESFYSVLSDKYGRPDDVTIEFENPYYDGDGYEMSAIALGKVNYSAEWEVPSENLDLKLQINKYQQVQLSYTNRSLVKVFVEERNAVRRNSFMP